MEKAKILIVAKESSSENLIKKTLRSLGYRVSVIPISKIDSIKKSKMEPDLILMDIERNGSMEGFKSASIIQENLEVPIIFLITREEIESFQRNIPIKPFGYLCKPFEERELQLCIERALYVRGIEKEIGITYRHMLNLLESLNHSMNGTEYVGPIRFNESYRQKLMSFKEFVSSMLGPTPPQKTIFLSPFHQTFPADQLIIIKKQQKYGLTQREIQILSCLAEGRSAKQISHDLHISYATVRTHVQKFLGKMGVHSRLEAVLKALRENLL
jgi:DNA-binding NarL/FixJ family response regulator